MSSKIAVALLAVSIPLAFLLGQTFPNGDYFSQANAGKKIMVFRKDGTRLEIHSVGQVTFHGSGKLSYPTAEGGASINLADGDSAVVSRLGP